MLFPRHPKPVVDPRPVVTHSIRHEEQAAPALSAQSNWSTHGPGSARETPIHFTAQYNLREYLALVREHLPTALKARGKRSDRIGFGDRLVLFTIVPLIFLLKKWRVGDCRFEIDASGLTRHSRSGPQRLDWRDAVAVHRYEVAYLVATKRGMMPLPYRCFSTAERERFDRWSAVVG